ncbi:hypothetical protein DACRYDRAFT_24953 [Dacryopinax primogenitus]|uniref:Yeast cell wall synthesis Kre9/Knh1-like N-terminal domain-containing protein n=1 Tax=Dacryopinax primogenitus (strain DJM 731) TaxID=1858805 RepID=M5FNJ7_DACPD|nr:uncharacterized protein DACRYDRAFT_24953 [Dacryopinax primogenitus]EJT97565.1 hypothetical protein DACRYDRAFT_24953 [Dacryopinax primogenitus]
MYAFAALLLAIPALGIAVTSPGQSTVWNANTASQTVAWTSVDTDATSFAIFLVNQDRTVLPTNNQLLSANVSTSAGSTTVTYSSGTWPIGDAFQINFARDSNSPDSLYAQSVQFNITGTASVSSSTTTASAASNTGSTLNVANTASTGMTSGTGTNSAPSSGPSDTLPNTGGSTSGALGTDVKLGAMVFALGLLGAVLA